ncbi:MAG: hypothetical protein QME75_12400 [Deltaproteobacteria bacterium]|nr:hypothetical protein [Deltaproteobacteria bacterium]
MATRLYFHGSGPGDKYIPPVSPAYAAEWERTSAAARRYLSRLKRNSVNGEASGSEYEAGPANDTLLRQFVSDPLTAQTISGTVKGQLRCRESDAAADFCRAIVIKVVSEDGSTVRGTLLAHFPEALASEFDAGATPVNRNFPPSLSLTQVDAQAGDRLVVEVGFRAFNTVTTAYTGYLHFNDYSGTSDLPEDETTADNLCGWLEFSADLTFQDRVRATQVLAQAEYDLPPGIQVTQVIAQVEYSTDPAVEGSGGVEVSGQGEADFYSPVLQIQGSGGVEASGEGEVGYWSPGCLEVVATGGLEVAGEGETGFRDGKLEVEAAGGLEAAGEGGVYLFNPLLAATGSGGVEVSGTAEVGKYKTIVPPPLEVVAEGGLEAWGFGDPRLAAPQGETITARGGVAAGGAGVADCIRPGVPDIKAVTAQGGLRLGGAGQITCEKESTLKDKAVTAGGGVKVGGEGLVVRSKPARLDVAAEGGVKVGHFQIPPASLVEPGESTGPTALAVVASGGLGAGGEGASEFFTPDFLAVESPGMALRVGGVGAVSFIQPAVLEFEAAGGLVLDEGAAATDVFETWAFTGVGFEPSIYSGFDFNSYCEYRGRCYGAREDGIHLLEGEDDDGREINTGVRIGPVNFGTNVQKRLRAVHPGGCGGRVQARFAADTGEEAYAELERGRLAGERFLGRDFVVDLAGFEQLSELEFTVLAQMKR